MRILPILLVTAALLAPRPAAAQEPAVAPGSPAVAPGRIALGADTLVMMLERGGEALEIGRMALLTEVVPGTELLRRVEVTRRRDGSLMSTDTFTLRRRDLSPVSQRSGDGTASRALDFAEGRVRGHRRGAQGDSVLDHALAGPAFYSNSVDLVLAALPLAQGYTARLSLAGEDGPETAELVVEGLDAVATGDGMRCEAWRVRFLAGDEEGVYWIGVRDRRLVMYQAEEIALTLVRVHGCAEERTPAS